MPTNEEVQMVLKLRDEATAEWRRASEDFKRTTKGMGDSVVDATGKLRSHGREVSELSKWVREQAREQRQQNFLFRQGKEVVGASSSVLSLFSNTAGRTSKEMRALSDSLNDGFTTFQGVGNVLTFLPGPIGLVAAGIAGLAVVFDRVNASSAVNFESLNKINDQLTDTLIKLKELPEAVKFSTLSADIILAEAELRRLKGTTIDFVGTALKDPLGTLSGRPNYVYKITGTPEQIKAAELALAQARLAMEDFTKSFSKENKLELKEQLDFLNVQTFPLMATNLDQAIMKSKELRDTFNGFYGDVSIQTVKFQTVNTEAIQAFDEGWRLSLGVAEGGFLTFYNTILTAHTNLKTATNALTDAVVNDIKRIAAEIAARATILTLLRLIFPTTVGPAVGFGSILQSIFRFHQGGTVPKAHGGAYIDAPPTREVVVIARGGETIRTEQQEAQLQRSLKGGGGNVFNFTFNAPVQLEGAVIDAIRSAVSKTGLSIEKLSVNDRTAMAVTLAS